MSAFIVDIAHIDTLVNAGHQLGVITQWGKEAREAGEMLWAENVRSVNYRYIDRETRLGYSPTKSDAMLHPHAILAAIACYRCQSCEHPGWEDSAAYAWCAKLTAAAEALLPGRHLDMVTVRSDRPRRRYTLSDVYQEVWEVTDLALVPTLETPDPVAQKKEAPVATTSTDDNAGLRPLTQGESDMAAMMAEIIGTLGMVPVWADPDESTDNGKHR